MSQTATTNQFNTLIEYFYDKERNLCDEPFLSQPFGEKWEEKKVAKILREEGGDERSKSE